MEMIALVEGNGCPPQDKVVWITGASSGIGEALASLLSSRGARLMSSNEPAQLEEVKERCTNREAHWALPLDLSEPDKMKPKADETLERYGHVDILVNNGGISIRALASETTLEIDRRIMEIDSFGHIALTKAVLPSMLQRKEGHIVVTTSLMGIMPAPLRSAYCAAKHALHGFFDTLRTEVWQDNIKVTLICPSVVRTNISKSALTGNGERFGRMDNLISSGISPEDCAREIMRAIVKGKREVIVGGGVPRGRM
jgi:dehydrogenase/reductase SDR family protein 7B